LPQKTQKKKQKYIKKITREYTYRPLTAVKNTKNKMIATNPMP